MKHGPVIILFRGSPVRFYRAAGNNVCELCTLAAATVFATPANARAKAILHRFAFEDYCMARPAQDQQVHSSAMTAHPASPTSPLQDEILAEMHTITSGRTAAGIAHSIGKPTLSVAAALRGLQSRKMVTSYLRGDQRWPSRYWCLANERTHRLEAAAGDVEIQTRAESAASSSVK